MAHGANNVRGESVQAKISEAAEDAYQAFAAIMRADAAEPDQRHNEYWTALRDTAFARFMREFERS